MGWGQGKWGIGRWGYTPGLESPSVDRPSPELVPKFDLQTRSYPLLSNGRVDAVHPVVQQVAHALGIRRRSLASTNNVGLDRVAIARASRAQKPSVVRAEVERALARLIARKDMKLLEVNLEEPVVSGRCFFEVVFVNLRDPERPRVSLRVQD